ncbi:MULTISPECIES: NAD(P)/FAD-dependent oxidoreductase [unclassified Mycobacterium]|uniref:flavin-containing monooxygenase n=1 Tax=unclassified Mycobacterium TaxID=2642494 RepID=UPI0029C87C72|nr:MULTISPECIES: NAD(P)/FAD-dependent oxidoreductase [unclassified Mycobacterium]
MRRTTTQTTQLEHVDVLIVGAGIAGIGLACHLSRKQPGRTFAVVEARDAIGGTWDLFRYPGIRSDADLYTYGFGFKPWTRDNAIADAHEILDYLQETIDENDLARHIHVGHKVLRADFSREQARWTVTLERAGDGEQFNATCGVLVSAAGYFDYDQGYTPDFAGREDFRGDIVHPQQWPEDLDYAGKKVVVIGSGATAVTLLPAMADTAGHVTMLQRSPSYVIPIPRQDPIANRLRRLLPDTAVHTIARKLNSARTYLIVALSQRYPKLVRRLVRWINTRALPEGYAVDTHFNPRYNPWDQRMCMVPDSDMFKAISRGAASVVTDRIVRFTERGILLESGGELDADIVVTATGLKMVPFGKIDLHVDGQPIDVHEHLIYKSMMLSDIPNFAFIIGYTNNSWTLKVDLVADHLCRLLAHMDRHGYETVTPVAHNEIGARRPYIDMGSGYLSRAMHLFPQRGSDVPWAADQDYKVDRVQLGAVADPALRFTESMIDSTATSAEVVTV